MKCIYNTIENEFTKLPNSWEKPYKQAGQQTFIERKAKLVGTLTLSTVQVTLTLNPHFQLM